MPGRLHTCYSPVRRSPAGDGKPPPPLPLDLHVLSLSLAFILSQDQTLRCYLYRIFFFSIPAGAPDGDARRRGGRPARRDASQTCLFGTDRGLHLRRPRPERDGRRAPVLFFLIHCKTFNVLITGSPRAARAEKLCKVTEVFRIRQIFRRFFSNLFTAPGVVPPRASRRGASVPFCGCKVTHFRRFRQTFSKLFLRKTTNSKAT